MHLPQLLLSVAIPFAAVVAGIPCHMIGVPATGYGYDDAGRRYAPGLVPESGVLHPFINPFTAGQGFDIVDTKDCLLRFQTPGQAASASVGDWIAQIAAGWWSRKNTRTLPLPLPKITYPGNNNTI